MVHKLFGDRVALAQFCIHPDVYSIGFKFCIGSDVYSVALKLYNVWMYDKGDIILK